MSRVCLEFVWSLSGVCLDLFLLSRVCLELSGVCLEFGSKLRFSDRSAKNTRMAHTIFWSHGFRKRCAEGFSETHQAHQAHEHNFCLKSRLFGSFLLVWIQNSFLESPVCGFSRFSGIPSRVMVWNQSVCHDSVMAKVRRDTSKKSDFRPFAFRPRKLFSRFSKVRAGKRPMNKKMLWRKKRGASIFFGVHVAVIIANT